MNDDRITDAFKALREEAARQTRTLGAPDVNAALEQAKLRSARFRVRSRIPQLAAAAAVLAVVVGLIFVVPRPVPLDAEVPEHLSLLVDSLYEDGSYLLNDIAPRWESRTNDYLDRVWGDLATELGDNPD